MAVDLDALKANFGLFPKGEGSNDGMEFYVFKLTVPVQFDMGQWQYVQTVVPARYRTLVGGAKDHWSLNDQTCLDFSVPYKNSLRPDPLDKTKNIPPPFPTGKGAYAWDTPEVGNDPTKNKTLAVGKSSGDPKNPGETENFKMYVMFKPAGRQAQWVPLQYWGWWWRGVATSNNMVWKLDDSGQGMNGAPTSTTDHPVWEKRKVQDGADVPD